ncbi:MAG: 4Fe-4S binding protein [Desulfobacteraceae bacterium]|nr:4Fe-4S binding protein [Desulfobacteraceae bacterium]MBC2756333.1 4Fe-4S binding protein [Desulfobacteraceae bacterium]
MKWEKDAEKAIQKVPFFVRKKVKARVEKEAGDTGKIIVSLADVKATQKRFLKKMDAEIRGFQLDACFGSSGCPNQIFNTGIQSKIEDLLKKEDLLGFLRNQVKGDLKFHHEFRMTVSDCPNACSQPQIKDIGIIGAQTPYVTENECIGCMECVSICKEKAIIIDETQNIPIIDDELCVACGQCIDVCPTRTIETHQQGYRIQIGGKLGRHPRLAEELPGIYSDPEVFDILRRCIKYYKANSENGERFAELVARDNTFVPKLIRGIKDL